MHYIITIALAASAATLAFMIASALPHWLLTTITAIVMLKIAGQFFTRLQRNRPDHHAQAQNDQ
ncbi:hypothetical protein [Novosphingobium sp. EMRT-2]|uniref:hypothetical protein n=1 Tax=Novosphingobium sp. EMRT-2 TaxID=2571749 RepID=UPI0010BE0C57|nr:hypothetical protein [Novosphingobium sp. EMRT-2]QCI92573.1 hypothetical protein FA702_02720 [Novosphingobium sp. EMRT-2]